MIGVYEFDFEANLGICPAYIRGKIGDVVPSIFTHDGAKLCQLGIAFYSWS